ncbi:MAG: hypothetical protein METHP_00251 [Methanoregula sp. SKADARSKE-2]|nr:MAG: hypothetical protein METHP_00251 [Methanoregula sp. SKADARSKE-2]
MNGLGIVAVNTVPIVLMRMEVGTVNSNNTSNQWVSDLSPQGPNIPRPMEKSRNGLTPIADSDTSSRLWTILSPGTMIDLMEIWISRIWNRRISHSGEDYLKRLSSLLVSEFLDGELMKDLRSYEQRSMRNTFGTVQTFVISRIDFTHITISAHISESSPGVDGTRMRYKAHRNRDSLM